MPSTVATTAGFLRTALLEDLFDAGQAGGDVSACGCRASGVEGAHGQLGAGLADGLGGHGADRFAEGDELVLAEVKAVALRADAADGPAGKRRTDVHAT